MATKLSIWNNALVRHLKKEKLSSLSSEKEPRYVFDTVWSDVVAEAFNEGDWNFAKKSAALVLNNTETPGVGWSYVFDYPDDYERTLVVGLGPDFNSEFYGYQDQGGFLHSNSNVQHIHYISNERTADNKISTWPTMFAEYVAVKLAYETCGKLTGGASLEEALEKKLKKALRQAKSVDARNEPNKRIPIGSWLRARRGFYGDGNRLGNTILGGELVLGEGDVGDGIPDGAVPEDYAPVPAPAGFHWEFVTAEGIIVTSNGIPVVSLVAN